MRSARYGRYQSPDAPHEKGDDPSFRIPHLAHTQTSTQSTPFERTIERSRLILPSATTLCSANQNMSPSDSNHSPQVSVEQQTMNKIKTATRSTTANGSSGAMKVSSAETMEMEHLYSAHNYHPLPVDFARASGAKVWDPEGREYLDFLSACKHRQYSRRG